MSGFEFKEMRDNGDATGWYNIVFHRSYTVSEFVNSVIKRKNNNNRFYRGRIQLYNGSWNPVLEHPTYRYTDGSIMNPIEDDILNKEIIEARADGGWGIMDYILKLKED